MPLIFFNGMNNSTTYQQYGKANCLPSKPLLLQYIKQGLATDFQEFFSFGAIETALPKG